ncbi:MAG TPA: hypothetical protein VHO03_05095 [Ignavibacteriales bacterium]|nr:hypothetical protein [Ignavibacteriales bacterium]
MKKNILFGFFAGAAFLLAGSFNGCSKSDTGLAPYTDKPELSQLTVEKLSFRPNFEWLGGYVSVLGVNRGSKAALDSTLVWLVYAPGNSLHFPVQFGSLPPGAQDLTSKYGGKKADSLSEDVQYTYWLMKEDAWNQVKTASEKNLTVDSSLSTSSVVVAGDSVRVTPMSFARVTENLDVFVNITSVESLGGLADITVTQSQKDNYPVIRWKIKKSDVTDSTISVIGLNEGNQYTATGQKWEVWSVDSSSGKKVYGKNDVIPSPLALGKNIPGTQTFVEFPAEGLKRGIDYYLWIANKSWDQQGHTRFTQYYAYAVFHTK